MSNFLLGFNNFADAGTLSGGSWTIALSKLQTPIVTDKARSNGLTLANTIIRADLLASQSIRIAALTNTNLTSAATYRITWYSDAYTTAVANSGWLSIPGYPSEDPDNKGVSIFHDFGSTINFRYFQWELNDTGNTAGYVEAGRLFFPEEAGFSRAPDVGVSDELTANTPRKNSLGGVGYFNRRKPVRKLTFAFNVMSAADAPKVRRIRSICNLNKQLIVIPDTTDTSNFGQRCFVATLTDTPKLQLLTGGYVSGQAFDLTEVL